MQTVIIDSKLQPLQLPDVAIGIKALKRIAESLTPGDVVYSEIPTTSAMVHTSYLNYLEQCWATHTGVVFSPDIFWFTLMCELAGMVREDPERYRALFSTSKDKQEIVVMTGDAVVMPMDRLTDALSAKTPLDVRMFLPQFGPWQSLGSKTAVMAALADAASPFYNYSMLMCGIPKIVLLGDEMDWTTVQVNWEMVRKAFCGHTSDKDQAWLDEVARGLDLLWLRAVNPHDDEAADFWADMFKLNRCGSGHETEVAGWFGKLFRKQPRPRYAGNFAQHTAAVHYRSISIDTNFLALHGPLWSMVRDGVAYPEFGQIIIQKPHAQA